MRISKDEMWLKVAEVISERSTCKRRSVGCVLIDGRGYILSTGYNGPAAGKVNCITSPCEGANLPSGVGLDKCQAVHAEQNALMQCSDIWKIDKCYVNCSPCIHCLKMLLNTGCQEIVFRDHYPWSDLDIFGYPINMGHYHFVRRYG